MKAIILCAGKGKRLKPFTFSIPKHLLTIGNKTVLSYLLDDIIKYKIKSVGLVVNRETKNIFEEYLEKNRYSNSLDFTFIIQEKSNGLADACYSAKNFIGQDDFLMFLGDNLIPDGLKEMYNENNLDSDSMILVSEVTDPRPFGVVELDSNGSVSNLVEKPENPKSNLIIVGIYYFKPTIFNAIENIKPSLRGELEITDAIKYLLMDNKKVKAIKYKGTFIDIGNFNNLLTANTFVLDNIIKKKTRISDSAIIENSKILDHVSIGNNSTIRNSIIENSIIMEDTIVEDAYIKDSVVGNRCRIYGNNQELHINIYAGDNTNIRLF